MGNNSLVDSLWDSFISSADYDSNNIMLVKYFNSKAYIPEKVKKYATQKDVIVVEHVFSPVEMQSVAEPFMDSIRKIYNKYFAKDVTPLEFVENAGVYSMQRDAFASYLKDGKSVRYEDPILCEIKYEYKRFMLSIASILNYIARYKKLFFVLCNLHYANITVLEFIRTILSSEEKYRINIYADYNEAHPIEGEIKEPWMALLSRAQHENKLFESGIHDEVSKGMGMVDEFIPETQAIKEYIVKLGNMVKLLCTRQADYYLKKLFQEMEKGNVTVKPKERISLLTLYAANSLYSFDMHNSLLLGEELLIMLSEDMHKERYNCLYIMALAQAHLTQINLAQKHAKNCEKQAIMAEDEVRIFKAKALQHIVTYYSWVNIFYCDFSENLDEEIIALFNKYKYYNTLNYLLVFGFENDEETARKIVEGRHVPEHFNRAIESGKWLGNNEFLLNAYMKNIIMYTEYGHHKYVEELYKKRILIIRQENEIVKIGHMYNGLGYNCIVDEQYIQANTYLNEALKIDMECEEAHSCAETLYNMAMNCICAWDYEDAQKYLETALKIIKSINMFSVAVCNTSKLYGMLALCYYHMGRYYDSHLYVSKIELMGRHILSSKGEPDYTKWDDDFFFYYLVKGLLAKHDKDYERADECYERADFHQNRSKGFQYYSVAQLALERADLYYEWGKPKKAEQVLNEGITYCREHNLLSKIRILMKKLEDRREPAVKWDLPLTATTLKAAERMAENIGVKLQLKRKQKDIDFLTTWQEALNDYTVSVDKMINSSMMTIQNTFNLDGLIYIQMEEGKPVYSTDVSLKLSKSQVKSIVEYFNEHVMAFVTTRGERVFFDYEIFTDILGVDKVATIIGIPLVSNEKLESVVVGYVNNHRNFTANKIVYNYDDLTILKFAFRQLLDAVGRLNTREELELANRQLSQNSITDSLTGLYNRQGFKEKIAEGLPATKKYKSNAVAYIDFDNFKYYNDTFGHNVGDDILVTFAGIAKELLGNNGYIVRYGGDEFVVIMPGKTDEMAAVFAKRLLKSFAKINARVKEIVPVGTHIHKEKVLSASVGISQFEECDDISVHTALTQADEALYFVKRTTKNDYMLYKEIPKH